jgi:hypothetical protein
MEQLSLQSNPNSDSELSTLGYIEHDSDVLNDLSQPPDEPDTSLNAPNFHSEVAQTDPNAQYQFQRDLGGGACWSHPHLQQDLRHCLHQLYPQQKITFASPDPGID